MDSWASNGTEIRKVPDGGPSRRLWRWRRASPKRFEPEEIDVRAIRERSQMSKVQFAACFGIPVETLRHWERGDRKPRGAALVLLHVIARDPRAVIRSLGSPFHIPYEDPDPPIKRYRKRTPR
ncbi:MAG TPA: helix-turn-helix domain-containing protein [Usitatibacter sp.]|nr:helix-turn-helix domain-containing protein [Usitatibacter sp.]